MNKPIWACEGWHKGHNPAGCPFCIEAAFFLGNRFPTATKFAGELARRVKDHGNAPESIRSRRPASG
jgi:hypothetical protein